ncbi:hypothetical protein [Methylobacterium sp. WSM2598]|uniref:hypothetical protein n=1 Tax=Methylobacterium sp. WSM2598 TaxID=398261 RepID=UPI0003623D72|nr:hypothetical protein [Methylobacterium sp. WSM2598]
MTPMRKIQEDRGPIWDDEVLANCAGEASEEDLRRLEELVRPEFEQGEWQVDDGPGW